jgi:hypothetical protein
MFYNQFTKSYSISNRMLNELREEVDYVNECLIDFRKRSEDLYFYDKFVELIKPFVHFDFFFENIEKDDNYVYFSIEQIEKAKKQIEELSYILIELWKKNDLTKYGIENIHLETKRDFVHIITGILGSLNSTLHLGVYVAHLVQRYEESIEIQGKKNVE